MPTDDLGDVALAIVVFGVALLIGVSVWSTMAGMAAQQSTNGDRVQTAQPIDGDSWYSLSNTDGVNETVLSSRGYAVNLTGASDSFVQSNSNIDIATDDNWTVATWARVDPDAASRNMTVLSVNGRLVFGYNGSSGNWTAWYYDDGSRDSYELEVTAPGAAGNWTHLTATATNDSVTLYRNNSAQDSVDLNQSSSVSSPVNSTNFDGRLEETRTFDDVLNSSERAELIASPVAPQRGLNRTSRIMYDEPYANQQLILFSGASLEQSNVTFADGFDGRKLSESEYEWNTVGPRLKVTAALPVAYVDYTIRSLGPGTVVPELNNALGFAALLPLLLIIGLMLTYLRDTQGR